MTRIPAPTSLHATLALLAGIEAAIDTDLARTRESLGELRRLHEASEKRRGGPGSRDADKYALGSVLAMIVFGSADGDALLGLFWNPDLMLRWFAEARVALGPSSFRDLYDAAITARPDRQEWLKRWGVCIRFERNHALYMAGFQSFFDSGKADDPDQSWRRKPVSADQRRLIALICDLRDLPLPTMTNRGEAFEWICNEGGNPRFWAPPEQPEAWNS